MSEQVDFDKLSDEEFEEYLNAGEFEADETDDEIAGEEDLGEEEETGEDDSLGSDEDPEQDEDENDEDTDHDDEDVDSEDSDADTNDDDDGDDQDTEDEEEEDADSEDEANAQVENGSSEDDGDKDADSDGEDKDKDPESKDGTDTTGESDGKNQDTDEVDYKKEYAKYKGFYDEVTSEFTANGKKMRGFDDPKKIIQAQQMAAGFSEKMAGFKKYRPYMSPLQERGMLEDEQKFNLAMNLIDGDKEALKQHIKNLEIDPMDLDLEDIKYASTSTLASQAEISLEDVMDSARSNGVEDKVRKVLGEQWDRESTVELLNDPQSGSDLIEHISNGAYDAVQDRIAEKKRTDVNGTFGSMKSIQQYREAAKELEAEYVQMMQQKQSEEAEAGANAAEEQAKVEAKKAKIEAGRKEAEYKSQVEKRNKEANNARKKASSVSKKKPKAKVKKKTFDPMALSDEDFEKQIDSMIYG